MWIQSERDDRKGGSRILDLSWEDLKGRTSSGSLLRRIEGSLRTTILSGNSLLTVAHIHQGRVAERAGKLVNTHFQNIGHRSTYGC